MLEAEKDSADRARALVCEELASSSQKLAMEQAEKRRMEQRIAELASNMLTSSNSSAEDLVGKLAKRKHTLDRQRLVMISLTQRLHERDSTIMSLQEEVERQDTLQRRLEATIDRKTRQLVGGQSAAAAQPDPNDAATLEDLRKRYSDYRASVATRLSSQATTLEDLRAQHEEWRRRLGAPQTCAPNATTRLDGAFVADATPRTASEVDRLQQQVAMAQRESQLLLQLLEGKIKSCVDGLASTFAGGGWAGSTPLANAHGELGRLQALVRKGAAALAAT